MAELSIPSGDKQPAKPERPPRDFYELLGVSRTASKAEIQKAFRAKASRCHPDHGGDAEKIIELCRARDVLLDDEARARYDQFGLDEMDEIHCHVRDLVTVVMCTDQYLADPVRAMCDHADMVRSKFREAAATKRKAVELSRKRRAEFVAANENTTSPANRDYILKCLDEQIAELGRGIVFDNHNVEVCTRVIAFFNGLLSRQSQRGKYQW